MGQIIILILLFLIIYTIRKSFQHSPSVKKENSKGLAGENMMKDPVCNIYIPESDAVKEVIGGKTVYFCGNKCLEKFKNLSG